MRLLWLLCLLRLFRLVLAYGDAADRLAAVLLVVNGASALVTWFEIGQHLINLTSPIRICKRNRAELVWQMDGDRDNLET